MFHELARPVCSQETAFGHAQTYANDGEDCRQSYD